VTLRKKKEKNISQRSSSSNSESDDGSNGESNGENSEESSEKSQRSRSKDLDEEIVEVNSFISKLQQNTELYKWLKDSSGSAGVGSTKIRKIVEKIRKVVDVKKEKIVIFSMFRASLNLLGMALLKEKIKFVQIDGETKGLTRKGKLDKFKKDERVNVLLISYKVGGQGINITEANECILLEPWWTPAIHEQAESRLHRTGQTREVISHHVYFNFKGSIETRILDVCKKKKMIEKSYLGTKAGGSMMSSSKKVAKLDMATLGFILGVR
jgi:SNF2 family DNA or RNA helicase